jgi:hypothetical protein
MTNPGRILTKIRRSSWLQSFSFLKCLDRVAAILIVKSVKLPYTISKNPAIVLTLAVGLHQGLTAIPAPGVVSLSWSANTEPDLLGYLVYRREPPALNPVRLTEAPVQTTTFTDRAVRAGATYLYTVTAVDRSSHRNESAPSSEVVVTLP